MLSFNTLMFNLLDQKDFKNILKCEAIRPVVLASNRIISINGR